LHRSRVTAPAFVVTRSAPAARNCQDHVNCDLNDDGSTGTQCKLYVPVTEGHTYLMRVRRTARNATTEAYGRNVSGSLWRVTIQDVEAASLTVVGEQARCVLLFPLFLFAPVICRRCHIDGGQPG
jgi:hypothetical protein